MTGTSTRRQYGRFVARSLAIVVVLILVGFVPTRRLAGDAALTAMVAGCAISLASAVLAGWLLVAVSAPTPTARLQRSSFAMAVRLVVVVVLGLAAVLSGEFARRPLLLWVAFTYLALLPLEVMLAVASE